MTSTDAAAAAERFLSILTRVPPLPGLVFHGLSELPPATAAPIELRGPLATSRNPAVATENWTSPAIAAIDTATGRDLVPFSGHPEEQETVLLPDTVLVEVARLSLAVDVVVYREHTGAELDQPDALVADVVEAIGAASAADAVVVHSPGKYAGPLPL